MSEEYDVRGEKIALEIPRLICSVCGESIIEESFGDPTQHLYAEYRRRHNLLTPDQIRGIREMYNLSQESLATLIGTSPATLARYEGGSIQDKAYDQLLRACQNPAFMADLVRREGHRLSARQRSDMEDALTQAIAECAAGALFWWWRVTVDAEKRDQHQPLLPQISDFVQRTDRLAQLPDARRADLFFVAAIATADPQNPMEDFFRYRCAVCDGTFRELADAWVEYCLVQPDAARASSHSVEQPTDLHVWPRPRAVRLIRELAAHFERLDDDEVHRSIVLMASKRLLRSRYWPTLILQQDLLGSVVFACAARTSSRPLPRLKLGICTSTISTFSIELSASPSQPPAALRRCLTRLRRRRSPIVTASRITRRQGRTQGHTSPH